MADNSVADTPVLRSPIEATVTGLPAGLALTDCSPLAKVQIRAAPDGTAAAVLGVPSGRAARDEAGTLTVGSGPGEWLLIGAPGQENELLRHAASVAERAPGELVTAVDLTHGRALMRLAGGRSAEVLALVCGISLSDAVTPDGSALRTAVAAVATDIVRDDEGPMRSYLLGCERSSGQYLFGSLARAAIFHGETNQRTVGSV